MEQVSQLAALAEAVFDYHKHCYDVMESLVATLNNKYVAVVYYTPVVTLLHVTITATMV